MITVLRFLAKAEFPKSQTL